MLRLRQELPPAVPGQPDPLGETLQAAFDCPADDRARREALLCTALDLALPASAPPATPPTAVPVLEALAYGPGPLAPETLRRCAAAMTGLTNGAPGPAAADESPWPGTATIARPIFSASSRSG